MSNWRKASFGAIALLAAVAASGTMPAHLEAQQKPNIIVIMGDDIGWFNIGAYNQGMMAGRTPNLDQLAAEGMRFTDYYAEASCTAGPGQLHHRRAADPHRHDHGRPGRLADRHPGAGGDHRHRAQVDGLRHRPVRQEPPGRPERVPAHGARLRRVLRLPLSPGRDGGSLPPQLPAGPARTRSARATWSTAGRPTTDDPTVQPRWGKIGKQKIEDAGPLCPEADGDRSTTRSSTTTHQVPRQGEEGQQAVLPVAQPDAHARRDAPLAQVRGDAQLGERLVGWRKPAWRSSTTSSARS